MLYYPRSVIVGLSDVVLKFGLEPIYNFGDIAIFILCLVEVCQLELKS